jgi:hypothetical protein
MKIFKKDGKINFVDKNNVFLGYDMRKSCCENADWFISDTITKNIQDNDCDEDLEEYVFDISFFKEVTGMEFFEGGMAIFRIVNGESKKEKFIHIFNAHNGYYHHGFLFKNNEEYIQEGSL